MKRMSVSIAIVVAAWGAFTGCGTSGGSNGSNGGGTPPPLTQAQAQVVGTAISDDLGKALSSAISSPAAGPLDISSRDHIRVALERKSETKPVTKPDTLTCSGSSCTLSGTYTCPDGGTVGVSGSFSGTSTSLSGTVTETPSNCSDGTVDLNGDPNITVGVRISDNSVSTSGSVTLDGGVSFSAVQAGQFPSGSCTCNLTVSATVNDGSNTLTACSVSGTVCGQSINENCTAVPF